MTATPFSDLYVAAHRFDPQMESYPEMVRRLGISVGLVQPAAKPTDFALLSAEQQRARLRTLRAVQEGGAVRFVPEVHCDRDLRPRGRLCWDRIGRPAR